MLSFYFLRFFLVFHSVFLSVCVMIWILGMTKRQKKYVYFVPWGSGTAGCNWVDSKQQCRSTWETAPSGPPLAIIIDLCYWQAELCDQFNEFSSPVTIVYITKWKSGLWNPKRETPEEEPQKLEQSTTEAGTVASSTGVSLCFTGWAEEHYLNLPQFHS